MSATARVQRALVMGNKRLFTALRSDAADTVVDLPVRDGGLAHLAGNVHCIVVTYRKDGRPVAQPVWPGYDGDRVYVWTEEQAYKARRLRNDPRALIAPCSLRGKPLGPPVAARGRILESEDERRHAEAVMQSTWGWKRKLFERTSRPLMGVVYIEFTPA
jgi:PPOX class probable F420-dependent enzyme